MRSVENELRTVYGGTVYTCKCGYQCTKRTQCIAHVLKKHPLAIVTKLFPKYI